jgi:hypothetical protein
MPSVSLNGFNMHFAIRGEGEPLLLLHGGMGIGNDGGMFSRRIRLAIASLCRTCMATDDQRLPLNPSRFDGAQSLCSLYWTISASRA